MLERLTEVWSNVYQNVRTRYRWIGYILTIAALIYLGAIIIFTILRAKEIDWQAYWLASLISLGLYLLSLLIQYFVWARILSFHHQISWRDMQIFSRVLVMRRLPGGIWHWVGRTSMYAGTTTVTGKTILLANFLEWAMIIILAIGFAIAGIDVLPLQIRMVFSLATFILSLGLAFAWQPPRRSWLLRVLEGSLWNTSYIISWLLGGIILYILVQAAGDYNLGLLRALWIWAITGGVSFLIVFVPAGLGIREITLTGLLQLYIPLTDALLIPVLIRLIFTLADVLWGSLGWVISNRYLPYQDDNSKPP